MDTHLQDFLKELYREGREFDAAQPDRLERRRNLEPDSAALLAVLVRAVRPQRLLELGTSNGYSTIWLADAALAVRSEFTSVEVDPGRLKQARANLRAVGLVQTVTLVADDAANVLRDSERGHGGMIFLDAERPAYTSYWPDLVRTLEVGGLLVVDNVISHAQEVAEFRELISADERVTEALSPTGAGLLLVVKRD
ncbi:MAG TPA: class I SAM-dependent methyltransferase [Solirubrobacteraceae bacterium]|nr:class I SAM-dependent methyltransferase [Solirubrobacteraceae bacterium]